MSEWFELHPQILERESRQLSSNSHYEEVAQRRDVLFVSTGNIKVRANGQTQRYPVVIVYPKATPYALPRVYLIKSVLTEAELDILASLAHHKVSNFLSSKVKYYYRRHQNEDGSLCVLEQDNLDQIGAEIFDANAILKRVRKYLAGFTTNHFPPEGSEVELFSHYPHKAGFHVLLTDSFYIDTGRKGEFYLNYIYEVPKSASRENLPNVYFGACLVNQTASGIQIDNSLTQLPFMPEGLKSREEIVHNQTRLKDLIKGEELIAGHWWHLTAEPNVFKNIQELVVALGEGDIDKGVAEVVKSFWPKLKAQDQSIFIGLRFPNRRGELDWVILVLKKITSNNHPLITGEPNVIEVLGDYQVTAAYSEVLTGEKHHLRNQGRIDHNIVKNKILTVIGCGALGSETADIMAKGGIGTVCLVDNQIMFAHNSIRHLASCRQANQRKVDAVATILREHNPYINIIPLGKNILEEDLPEYFPENGIGVSSIADDNTESYLNEQALLNKRTVFYVRALRGGKAARIFRVIPGQDACFHCLSIYRSEGHESFIDIPEDHELPTIRNECNNPIRPSSAADFKLIAALAGKTVLDYLQSPNNQAVNHWVWASDSFSGINITSSTPSVLEARKLAPHSQCQYCQGLNPIKVILSHGALEYMRDLVLATPGVETGGVLVGNLDANNNTMQIVHASGPGPDSQRTASRFERDVEYCQNFVNQHAARQLLYLGEWHSHPNNNNKPSGTDIESLSAISTQKEYLTTRPLMIIFSREGEYSCTVHPVEQPYYFVTPTVE